MGLSLGGTLSRVLTGGNQKLSGSPSMGSSDPVKQQTYTDEQMKYLDQISRDSQQRQPGAMGMMQNAAANAQSAYNTTDAQRQAYLQNSIRQPMQDRFHDEQRALNTAQGRNYWSSQRVNDASKLQNKQNMELGNTEQQYLAGERAQEQNYMNQALGRQQQSLAAYLQAVNAPLGAKGYDIGNVSRQVGESPGWLVGALGLKGLL